MITLTTQRLILRNYRMEDLDAVYDCFSHPDVAKYEDFRPMTRKETEEKIRAWLDKDYRMVAVLKETGEVIGSVGYRMDDDADYSIDYDFNPKFWGKGYATEAASEVMRHLFDDLQVPCIYGDCDAKNERSNKMFARLGFSKIGTDPEGSYKDDESGNPIVITVNIYEKKNPHEVPIRYLKK